jgi:acetylornithine deacetylase/succinyl-diaminopimelate desuccinylase-like protein
MNRSIHKIDEAVTLEEIEPLARIYRETIEALLA